jgi:hypothetical protein
VGLVADRERRPRIDVRERIREIAAPLYRVWPQGNASEGVSPQSTRPALAELSAKAMRATRAGSSAAGSVELGTTATRVRGSARRPANLRRPA